MKKFRSAAFLLPGWKIRSSEFSFIAGQLSENPLGFVFRRRGGVKNRQM
jgi:hypothetical protein